MSAMDKGMDVRRRALPAWVRVSGLVVLAAVLRIPGLSTDFWLDEIRSYEAFAIRARSIADIFIGPGFRDDNNQHLNTIVLYLFRDHPGWLIYRLPAFAAGLYTVALASAIGGRRNRANGWLAGLLVAVSFIMVVYSTEARGYAYVLLFSLLAFDALQKYLDKPTVAQAALFWLFLALGLSAHLEILDFYAGALLWSVYRFRKRPWPFIALHACPLTWTACWGLVIVKGMTIAGGPVRPWTQIADGAFSWTLGYPLGTIGPAIALTAAIVLVFADGYLLFTEQSDEGWFYYGAILVPLLTPIALHPPYFAPRYFLIPLLMLLLVVARLLARGWNARGAWRFVAVAATTAFVVGNVVHVRHFAAVGRGAPSQAIRYIVDHSPTGPIAIGGVGPDLWTTLPVAFYEQKLGLEERIRYAPLDANGNGLGEARVEWIVVPGYPDIPPGGSSYALRKHYPSYGPSGQQWDVYQRKGDVAR